MMLTSIILFFGISFISAVIAENKIAQSQAQSIKAYYLSEAGIQEALWKIQNDSIWKSNFESDANWSDEILREDIFSQGSSFKVKIKNLEIADAEIVSTGLKTINSGSKARRVSKLEIFKTVEPPLELPSEEEGSSSESLDDIEMDNAVLITSNKINVWGINLNAQGNIFSQEDFDASLWSGINVKGFVKSCGNVNIDATSVLNADRIYSNNFPPASSSMSIPAVEFDDLEDSESLKARAQALGQVYTSAQFSEMLSENPARSFSGAVYITGNIILQRGINLAVSGALASDGSITVGDDWQWWNPCGSGDAKITISAPEESPSGIFAKNQVIIKTCIGSINIRGVVYAGNSISFSSISNSFSVTGSIVSRNMEGTGLWKPITLIFDDDISKNSLRTSGSVIDSGYWED